MTSKTIWTCDGCGVTVVADDLPDGWLQTLIRVEERDSERLILSVTADLCHACLEKREAYFNPHNWPRDKTPAAKPNEDGWIEWKGGECPVPGDTLVEFRTKDSPTTPREGWASHLLWKWGDGYGYSNIVAYRVIKEAE